MGSPPETHRSSRVPSQAFVTPPGRPSRPPAATAVPSPPGNRAGPGSNGSHRGAFLISTIARYPFTVFEIGNSLREARLRRGIEFAQAELATKVRVKYLRALEDEQFDLLPAQTYVKGFLRTYAEYLGLDGQLYVDEYNSRYVAGDELEVRARRSTARPSRSTRRFETMVVLAVLALIATVTVVVISAWNSSGGSRPPATQDPIQTRTTVHHAAAPLLLLRALRSSTHVTARKGSATGDIAFDGTLQKGDQPIALRGTRLWVQISTPENLRVEVRGRAVHIPGLAPRVIIVTRAGWQVASS